MFSRIIQVISSLLIAAAVNSHPGHGDVVQLDQSSAIEAASSKIEDFIGEGKLDSFLVRKSGGQGAACQGLWSSKLDCSYVDSESNKHLEMIFSMTGNFISLGNNNLRSCLRLYNSFHYVPIIGIGVLSSL